MKFLVIDDDPIARMIVEKNLRLAGFKEEILMVPDGRKAMELLKTLKPEDTKIILDLNMPIMNGFDLMDEVMESGETSWEIHILTSSSLEVDKDKCLTYPMVKGFIVKPVRLSVIKELI